MASYNSSKKPSVTPESIVRDVRAGNICPVYYLMGEEGYYIDKISEFLIDTLLTKEEQDFNLVTFFGADAEIEQIIMAAKAFPMGAKYTVVLVKEAQALSDLDKFEFSRS
jgi:DNA polymerase-3 subunit delta